MSFWEIALPPLVTVLATALTGLVVQGIIALAKFYIPKLKLEMGETNFRLAMETANMIVRAIEQSPAYIEWDGPEKKQRAVMSLANWFESKGIPFTAEMIDGLIESAVQQMNAEISPILVGGERLEDVPV